MRVVLDLLFVALGFVYGWQARAAVQTQKDRTP